MLDQVPRKQNWVTPKLTTFGDVSALTATIGSFTKTFGGFDSVTLATIPPTHVISSI